MRITTVHGKVAYVVAAPIVLLLLQLLAVAVGGFRSSTLVIGSSILAQLAFVIVGIRSFRGEGEPVRPPRVWWRMTARPPAGFVLGCLFLLQAGWSALTQQAGPITTAAATVSAFIGLAYLAASAALVRHLQEAGQTAR
jgi:hypothetical protein